MSTFLPASAMVRSISASRTILHVVLGNIDQTLSKDLAAITERKSVPALSVGNVSSAGFGGDVVTVTSPPRVRFLVVRLAQCRGGAVATSSSFPPIRGLWFRGG